MVGKEKAKAVQGRESVRRLRHLSMAAYMENKPPGLLWQLPQLGPVHYSCLYAAQEPSGQHAQRLRAIGKEEYCSVFPSLPLISDPYV